MDLYSWQYNGKGRWDDIIEWCGRTFGLNFYTNQYETIYFHHKEDYTMFLLRWA